jgi:UDP-N-acetylmuramyl pentapeptide phosphotransferase/UDP-N-acetylglucosamine-1-phosphate transferase
MLFSLKKEMFIDKVDINKPQKFHKAPVPRIGGLGIFTTFALLIIFVTFQKNNFLYLLIILVSIPVVFIGLYEDFRGNISPKKRILFMCIGSILAIIFLDSIVWNIGFLDLPVFIAIPFTVFAIVGLTNAINMIDGFNGLASGISVITLLSFIYILNMLGDFSLIPICSVLAGAILGFMVLNFPFGKIFLGDGGAYFLGFILAIISILMVNRNTEISPWFPVVMLAYPIFDVLFAIFRRKFIHGTSPFSPDKYHLHSLIFKKLSKNNPLTSVIIFSIVIPFDIIALYYFNNNYALFFEFVIFCCVYLLIYYFLGKNFFRRLT